MENLPLILVLIGVMWFAQLILTYKQAMKFNDSLKALRAQGESAVGMGGKRYRGGRAFVAIARQGDTVVDARVMTGWTVFAGPKPFPALKGLSLTELAGDGDIPQLNRKVRSAAQMAASTLLKPKVTEVSE